MNHLDKYKLLSETISLNEKVSVWDSLTFDPKALMVGWSEKDFEHFRALINKVETEKDKARLLGFIKHALIWAGSKFTDKEGKEKLIDKIGRIFSSYNTWLPRKIHQIINSKSPQERAQHISNLRKLYAIVSKIKISA